MRNDRYGDAAPKSASKARTPCCVLDGFDSNTGNAIVRPAEAYL